MKNVKIGKVEIPYNEKNKGRIPRLEEAYYFGESANLVLEDILENRGIMLIGHTGVGKTSMIEQIAARSNNTVFKCNMNGQTTYSDFVGLYSVKDGDMVWIDGFLPKAMREGHWLIVDEIDFADANILAALNSVLEPEGALVLKERGHEVIEPHANFRIFSTANTAGNMAKYRGLYQGTNIMNEAFMDRWRVYKIDYFSPEEEIKILIERLPRINKKIATIVVRVGNMIREAFQKEEIRCTMSLRRLIDWTDLMVRLKDPVKAAQPTILAKVSDEEGEVIKGIITRVMMGNKE